MTTEHTAKLDIQALLDNGFDEKTARQLYAQGEEVAIFVMLALATIALKNAESNDVIDTNDAGTDNNDVGNDDADSNV
jgi:hypothetical protein